MIAAATGLSSVYVARIAKKLAIRRKESSSHILKLIESAHSKFVILSSRRAQKYGLRTSSLDRATTWRHQLMLR